MNRTEIATATRRFLNQLGTGYVQTSMVYDSISGAAKKLNLDTGYNRGDLYLSIKTGVREYEMSATVMDVYEARLGTGSDRVKLTPTDRAALYRDEQSWEGATAGTPTQYYTDGRYIGFHPRPIVRTAWTNSNAYSDGDTVIPSGTDNGFVYECITTSGISAASEPAWPTTIDGTVTDNNIVWQQVGSTRVYLRCLKDVGSLTATESPSWCPTPFHRSIAKLAAVDIAHGFEAEDDGAVMRIQALYGTYLEDVKRMSGLAGNRSREYLPRVTVKGYSTFRS